MLEHIVDRQILRYCDVKFQHIAKINDKNIGNKIDRLSRSSVCLKPEDFPCKADNKSANLS
jgi:hypothetical protein